MTLSVNVAGITNTRSLSHPLFQVAFQGAPQFGVRTFEPATCSTPRRRAVRTEQVHGGVYDLPWQFESAVKTAAVLAGRSAG